MSWGLGIDLHGEGRSEHVWFVRVISVYINRINMIYVCFYSFAQTEAYYGWAVVLDICLFSPLPGEVIQFDNFFQWVETTT